MSNIITSKPTAPSPVVTNAPKVTPPLHKNTMVDTKYTPLSSLIAFVEGYSWKVNYYQQIIDTGSQLQGQDPKLQAQHQQYRLIKALELKAQSPISWTQDEDSKSMTATGTSTVHSSVIPNAGDMFLTDVGDGRTGVFMVNRSTQQSLLKQTTYSIDYTLIYFTDDQSEFMKDLTSKVQVSYNYVRDFLNYGQNPLVVDSDFAAIQKLQVMYKQILDFYLGRFYSREYRTLLVPGQSIEVYDHYVISFINRILNVNDHPNMNDLTALNVGDDDVLKLDQLYTLLIKKDVNAFKYMQKKMGVVGTNNFSVNPVAASIRFTRIDFVVYPIDAFEAMDQNHNNLSWKGVVPWTYEPSKTIPGDINLQIGDNILNSVGTRPIIHPVHKDDHYVFSKAFYDNSEGMSFLEILTRNYIHGKPNPPQDIVKALEGYSMWGAIERFYYLPIALTLIKNTIRGY